MNKQQGEWRADVARLKRKIKKLRAEILTLKTALCQSDLSLSTLIAYTPEQLNSEDAEC